VIEDFVKFLPQSVCVNADWHPGNPQPNIISVVGAESTRTRLVLLDLVPVVRVIKPVDSRWVNELFPVDRQHERPLSEMKRSSVVASSGEIEVL
jgi:hypothetical protein